MKNYMGWLDFTLFVYLVNTSPLDIFKSTFPDQDKL